MVGGKQIEVTGVISDEDYAKGRCFQDAIVDVPLEMTAKAPVRHQRPQLAKSFAGPTVKDVSVKGSDSEAPVCKPRHDPNSPGTYSEVKAEISLSALPLQKALEKSLNVP